MFMTDQGLTWYIFQSVCVVYKGGLYHVPLTPHVGS